MTDLTNKTVLITGSAGFLGKHLVPLFEGKCDLILPTHEDYDLTLQNVCGGRAGNPRSQPCWIC